MSEFTLSAINIYPVKSLGGIRLAHTSLSDRGLTLDRRWMLVNPEGQFITQREFPEMVFLEVSLLADRMVIHDVRYPDTQQDVLLEPSFNERIGVQIWKSRCQAVVYGEEINDWFSTQLNTPCRLVFMPQDSRRDIDRQFQMNREIVSFADGFPSLMIGESSLIELNQRLDNPVSMDRFRTNLVFSGGQPFSEDSWKVIRIGDVQFRVAKPCARCVITTVDSQTGKTGLEPMRTLATYRRDETGKVMFGQNLIHQGRGVLKVGMPIDVLESGISGADQN